MTNSPLTIECSAAKIHDSMKSLSYLPASLYIPVEFITVPMNELHCIIAIQGLLIPMGVKAAVDRKSITYYKRPAENIPNPSKGSESGSKEFHTLYMPPKE